MIIGNPELHRQRVSASLQGKFGPESRRWKGENAGYVAIHLWNNKHYDKGNFCQICDTTEYSRLEWANISGTYKRTREDWLALCPSCHGKYDGKALCCKGHYYTTDNTYINPRGHRHCRICRRVAQTKWRIKHEQALKVSSLEYQ